MKYFIGCRVKTPKGKGVIEKIEVYNSMWVYGIRLDVPSPLGLLFFCWTHMLTRLRKKTPVFTRGDRINTPKGKGTISHISPWDELAVRLDDGSFEMIKKHAVKKLRKKPIEFKKGDRISVPTVGKGTIRDVCSIDGSLSVNFDVHGFGFCKASCAKKLKRKVFKSGDRVLDKNIGKKGTVLFDHPLFSNLPFLHCEDGEAYSSADDSHRQKYWVKLKPKKKVFRNYAVNILKEELNNQRIKELETENFELKSNLEGKGMKVFMEKVKENILLANEIKNLENLLHEEKLLNKKLSSNNVELDVEQLIDAWNENESLRNKLKKLEAENEKLRADNQWRDVPQFMPPAQENILLRKEIKNLEDLLVEKNLRYKKLEDEKVHSIVMNRKRIIYLEAENDNLKRANECMAERQVNGYVNRHTLLQKLNEIIKVIEG